MAAAGVTYLLRVAVLPTQVDESMPEALAHWQKRCLLSDDL